MGGYGSGGYGEDGYGSGSGAVTGSRYFFGDNQIDSMLGDWGNIITVGAVSAPCAKDESDTEVLEQYGHYEAQAKHQISVLVRTNNFPNIRNNDLVDVDGVSYRVWKHQEQDDGALTTLQLRLAVLPSPEPTSGGGETIDDNRVEFAADGSTSSFMLPFIPGITFEWFRNGLLQSTPGDYSVSGTVVTVTSVSDGDSFVAIP